jgi:acyl carrier protein
MWTDVFDKVLRMNLDLPADRLPGPDEPLASYGLDSMRTVSLLVDLEQAFGVTFADEMLVPATFATAGALWAALSQLLVGEG